MLCACVYCACVNCKNYLRAIIISLVVKYAANTIRERIQFEGEIYTRKYGMSQFPCTVLCGQNIPEIPLLEYMYMYVDEAQLNANLVVKLLVMETVNVYMCI